MSSYTSEYFNDTRDFNNTIEKNENKILKVKSKVRTIKELDNQ